MKTENFQDLKSKETSRGVAVELFTKVRDVPYALNADGNIEGLFEDGVAGYTRKHLYLLPRLKKLGYKVDIGIAEFDWRELPIPTDIQELLKDPHGYHMFLYVGTGKATKVVDATWDKGMTRLGFPVFSWDGVSSTGLAIKATNARRQNLLTLKTRAIASSTLKKLKNPIETEATPFNDGFNLWLGEMRGKI